MAGKFNESIDTSTKDFDKWIRPIVPLMFDGSILAVESDADHIAKHLDSQCGIDYLLMKDDRTYGIASRIQPMPDGAKPHNTFTVRLSRDNGAKTELEKRTKQIGGPSICPYWTFQAYVSPSGLLSMAVCKTADLVTYVLTKELIPCYLGKKPSLMRHTGADQHGQASFLYVSWSDFTRDGNYIRVYMGDKRRIYTYDCCRCLGNMPIDGTKPTKRGDDPMHIGPVQEPQRRPMTQAEREEHERLQRSIQENKRKVLGDKVDDIGKFDFMPTDGSGMVHLQTRE